MFSSTKLAISYAILAFIATTVNITTQDLAIRAYAGKFSILISMILGTAIGLFVKYFLDKRYIFYFKANNVQHDAKVFLLYTVMGLATTIVFWGFEFGFQYLFESKDMRYLGGIIGLTIGYITKYYLDKRFVFIQGG